MKRGNQNRLESEEPFRFIFITRHFNHSGYLILEKLIERGLTPTAVVLKEENDPLLNRITRPFVLIWYYLKCWFYRCPPLKTLDSEELLAKKYSIPVIKTKTMKDENFVRVVSSFQPDLMVMGGGWHELILENVITIPRLGCINTHPSLLPEFRGTSITRWQRLYGISTSGVSVHYVNNEFDTGEVIAQKEMPVPIDITPQELFYQLGNLAAEMIPGLVLRFAEEGQLPAIKKTIDSPYCQYYRRWKWDLEKLKIDFSQSLRSIHFFISANTQESYQYLGPLCKINGQQFFIRQSKLLERPTDLMKYQQVFENEVGKAFLKDHTLYLFREKEKDFLAISRIQKFDGYYKLRRSNTPDKFIDLKEPIRIEES